jgi:hypothetical protein
MVGMPQETAAAVLRKPIVYLFVISRVVGDELGFV